MPQWPTAGLFPLEQIPKCKIGKKYIVALKKLTLTFNLIDLRFNYLHV